MIKLRTGQSDRSPRRGSLRRGGIDDEAGFGLAEIVVSTAILLIIVVSFSNVVIDSLSAALLSRQREAAASIASNVNENAAALGQANLNASPSSLPACVGAQVPSLVGDVFANNAAGANFFGQCLFTVTVDNTLFTVSPVVAGTTTLFIVTVSVTWSSAKYSYVASTQVGT